MKKAVKKSALFSILLVLLVVTSILAGCIGCMDGSSVGLMFLYCVMIILWYLLFEVVGL